MQLTIIGEILDSIEEGKKYLEDKQYEGGWGVYRDTYGKLLNSIEKEEKWKLRPPNTIWDTATAIIALLKTEGSKDVVNRGLEWLKKQECNDDGGYPYIPREYWQDIDPQFQPIASSIYETSYLIIALLEAGEEPNSSVIKRAIQFLVEMHDQDLGAWGATPHEEMSVGATCSVIFALKKAGYNGSGILNNGITWLKENQRKDGGWGERWCEDSCSSLVTRTHDAVTVLLATESKPNDNNIRRAIRFLLKSQELVKNEHDQWGLVWSEDASELKATTIDNAAAAITALLKAGLNADSAAIKMGIKWLLKNKDKKVIWSKDSWRVISCLKDYCLALENQISITNQVIVFDDERPTESFEPIEGYSQLDSQSADSWIKEGLAFAQQGKYDEAINAYDKAIELDPRSCKAWYSRGRAQDNLGNYDKATRDFNKSIELSPENAAVWNKKGIVLSKSLKYIESLKAFNKAIEIDPNNEDAWYNRGLALAHLANYEEAIRAYETTIKLNPKNIFAWNNKGNVLSIHGKHSEAIKAYEKAIELNPNHVKAWNNKGQALADLGNFSEAINAFETAINIDSSYVAAWKNKGRVLLICGRLDEALRSFNAAIEIDEKNASAWNQKGKVLNQLGRYEEAVKAYEAAIKIDPQHAGYWFDMGIVLSALGKKADSDIAFAKSRKLEQ